MSQQTIVALYGQKIGSLAELLKTMQDKLIGIKGIEFTKYDLPQIHATLIGLEKKPGKLNFNYNFLMKRKEEVQMDISGFREYLRSSSELPFQIQIGGFKDRDYPFISRAQRPYKRSFSIQGNKAVIMGWPIRGKPLEDSDISPAQLMQESRLYPNTLDILRRSAQRFSILHTYHASYTDVDNDFYLRIGLFGNVDQAKIRSEEIQKNLRDFLSNMPPIILNIELKDLKLVSYEDETLPICEQTQPQEI